MEPPVNDDERKVEVKEPSRRVLVEWLVAFVRARKPEPNAYLTPAEIEAEVGVPWGDKELHFALISAKKELIRGTPPYEFKVSEEKGLLFLDALARTSELERRRRASRNLLVETLESAKTIDAELLDENGKRRLERSRAVSLFLLSQADRAARRKFTAEAEPLAIEDSAVLGKAVPGKALPGEPGAGAAGQGAA